MAAGYESSQGFVVKTGTLAVGEAVPSMLQQVRGIFAISQELIANGVLSLDSGDSRLTQVYAFRSPSTESALVLGRSANGQIQWRDGAGRVQKTLQMKEAAA